LLTESARRAIDNADPVTGMMSAPAASTDFPEEFGRTWPGWLAYSTSWHYGGLRAAEKLLQRLGERELAAAIGGVAGRTRANFARVFWNEATGFWNEGVHPTNPRDRGRT
jgi:GH15 family glucan-1,4-alpha-glucosidase